MLILQMFNSSRKIKQRIHILLLLGAALTTFYVNNRGPLVPSQPTVICDRSKTLQQLMRQEFERRYGLPLPSSIAESIRYSDVDKFSIDGYIKNRIDGLMELKLAIAPSNIPYDSNSRESHERMKRTFMESTEGKILRWQLQSRVIYLAMLKAFMEGTVIKNGLFTTYGVDLEKLAQEGKQYRTSLGECLGVR